MYDETTFNANIIQKGCYGRRLEDGKMINVFFRLKDNDLTSLSIHRTYEDFGEWYCKHFNEIDLRDIVIE